MRDPPPPKGGLRRVNLRGPVIEHLNSCLPSLISAFFASGCGLIPQASLAGDLGGPVLRGTSQQHCETDYEIRLARRGKIGTDLNTKERTAVLAYPIPSGRRESSRARKTRTLENHKGAGPFNFQGWRELTSCVCRGLRWEGRGTARATSMLIAWRRRCLGDSFIQGIAEFAPRRETAGQGPHAKDPLLS